jgi:hypothetical protein
MKKDIIGKLISRLWIGPIVALAIIAFLPKPAALADTGSIYVSYPDTAYSIETQVYPWPYPEWYSSNQIYEPNVTISIRPGVFGNFPGTDQISVDCDGSGTYGPTVSAGAGDLGDAFNFSPIYISNSGTVQCTFPVAGTYSPIIHVVRTGSGGCVNEGRYNNQECFSNPVTAEADFTLPSFTILPKDYVVNVWPDTQSPYVGKSPQNVGFAIQSWQTNAYCPPGVNCDFSVGGYFTYHVDCGDGSPVKNISGYAGGSTDITDINYNSQYVSQGGGFQWVYNALNTGPICDYTSPGVYQVQVSTDGLSGSSGTVYGGATVTLLPSGQLTDTVSVVPTTGEAPLNGVGIKANVSNIMPATGSWGMVNMSLRCDGNLPLEQNLIAGANPASAAYVYGNDGPIDSSSFINFNNSGTKLVSTTSTPFTCNYAQAGTHTPTVVVQQNGITAAAGAKVYVTGKLKCDGTDVLKAPTDYRLDWNTLDADHCAVQSQWNSLPISQLPENFINIGGSNGLGFSGTQPASGSHTFYDVEPGYYQYNLDCVSSDGTEDATSSCGVTVTP